MANVLNCGIVVSGFELLSYANFQTNTLRKGINYFKPQLWVLQYYNCSSTRKDLVLNNPRRLICHWTKKPKPNYLSIISFPSFFFFLFFSLLFLLSRDLTETSTQYKHRIRYRKIFMCCVVMATPPSQLLLEIQQTRTDSSFCFKPVAY